MQAASAPWSVYSHKQHLLPHLLPRVLYDFVGFLNLPLIKGDTQTSANRWHVHMYIVLTTLAYMYTCVAIGSCNNNNIPLYAPSLSYMCLGHATDLLEVGQWPWWKQTLIYISAWALWLCAPTCTCTCTSTCQVQDMCTCTYIMYMYNVHTVTCVTHIHIYIPWVSVHRTWPSVVHWRTQWTLDSSCYTFARYLGHGSWSWTRGSPKRRPVRPHRTGTWRQGRREERDSRKLRNPRSMIVERSQFLIKCEVVLISRGPQDQPRDFPLNTKSDSTN